MMAIMQERQAGGAAAKAKLVDQHSRWVAALALVCMEQLTHHVILLSQVLKMPKSTTGQRYPNCQLGQKVCHMWLAFIHQ